MLMVTRQLRDPDISPCLSESDASTSYFLKYKSWRFWNSIIIQRRQSGVQPPMPTAAERDEILGATGKMPY
uniref:Uncharacterized protein n=1 Tax=Jaculus jaculus TaxID=51337 RepID=A0A8C5KL42_JACJA